MEPRGPRGERAESTRSAVGAVTGYPAKALPVMAGRIDREGSEGKGMIMARDFGFTDPITAEARAAVERLIRGHRRYHIDEAGTIRERGGGACLGTLRGLIYRTTDPRDPGLFVGRPLSDRVMSMLRWG